MILSRFRGAGRRPRGDSQNNQGADGRRNARQARGNADVGLACLPRRSRRRRRRGAIIRSSLIKLREMSKDSAMPGKTDNADADYYIPRRPIHSRVLARVCVHAGLPGRGMCAAPRVYTLGPATLASVWTRT